MVNTIQSKPTHVHTHKDVVSRSQTLHRPLSQRSGR